LHFCGIDHKLVHDGWAGYYSHQAMARLRIDELLKERGITAYRLALSAGLTHSTVSRLRHGKATEIRLEVIDRLCEALDCAPGDLIELGGKKGPRKMMPG
jgi:putative transcriptional regulator